jgi:hypothetical protein
VSFTSVLKSVLSFLRCALATECFAVRVVVVALLVSAQIGQRLWREVGRCLCPTLHIAISGWLLDGFSGYGTAARRADAILARVSIHQAWRRHVAPERSCLAIRVDGGPSGTVRSSTPGGADSAVKSSASLRRLRFHPPLELLLVNTNCRASATQLEGGDHALFDLAFDGATLRPSRSATSSIVRGRRCA